MPAGSGNLPVSVARCDGTADAWQRQTSGGRIMQPIPTHLGWISRKPNSTGNVNGASPAFNAQLQSLLQKTRPAQPAAGPSRATTGPLHPGGMNAAAHHLLSLAGKG
jgi:hypothetical protein